MHNQVAVYINYDTPSCDSTFGHADMCWHVPTCAINLDTSDNEHLDLIWILACVSICGHADMCWYVPICADMCRYVPTCETTLSTSDTNHLNLILHAGMCQHIWTCQLSSITAHTSNVISNLTMWGSLENVWLMWVSFSLKQFVSNVYFTVPFWWQLYFSPWINVRYIFCRVTVIATLRLCILYMVICGIHTHGVNAILIFHKCDEKKTRFLWVFIPPSRCVQNLLEAAVTWQDIYQSGLCKFTPSFM